LIEITESGVILSFEEWIDVKEEGVFLSFQGLDDIQQKLGTTSSGEISVLKRQNQSLKRENKSLKEVLDQLIFFLNAGDQQ